MKSLPRFLYKNRTGFTFLEIILVLVILALVVGLLSALASRHIQDLALAGGGRQVANLLNESRQAAITQNGVVEVRLYATSPTSAPLTYQALQAFLVSASAQTRPLSGRCVLPSGIIIDGTAAHSSLVNENSQIVTDPSDLNATLRTHCFHFLPDGSTDLDPQQPWFLTLRQEVYADPAHFPANWVGVQLDAATGRVQMDQP